MNTIEEFKKFNNNLIDEWQRDSLEKQGITIIEDQDVYWLMHWSKDNPLVLEGKKPQEEVIFETEEALARLLTEEVVYMRSDKENKVFNFFVNCNDIFAWACADAEPLEYNELQGLYDMWLKDKTWGQQSGVVLNVIKSHRNQLSMP